jgi:hypothetical protein
MSRDFRQLFQSLEPIVTPNTFKQVVLNRIEKQKRKRVKLELFFLSLVQIFSIAGLVYTVSYLAGQVALSGFYQYLSLILSDGQTLTTYWQELSMALAESFPVFGLVALFSIIIFSAWSIPKTIINTKAILLPA